MINMYFLYMGLIVFTIFVSYVGRMIPNTNKHSELLYTSIIGSG
jgi:hypothetical protein